MKTQELKYVTRRRAAVLLGISEMELSRISTESGFGHREIAGEQEETYFTYEELRQICLLAVQTRELNTNEFPPAPLSCNPHPGSLPPAIRGSSFARNNSSAGPELTSPVQKSFDRRSWSEQTWRPKR
jgi:hypothetical protein